MIPLTCMYVRSSVSWFMFLEFDKENLSVALPKEKDTVCQTQE
jgi:hypothetical protein